MTDKPFTNREIELMLAGIDQKLNVLLDHVKETNGRVHKLEIVTAKLEKELDERDENLEKLILEKESTLKIWVLKALIFVTLAGSFIWIQESRDAVLHIIKSIL
jgi:small nuclear ribonucleoprotein (snRNP)-like protein